VCHNGGHYQGACGGCLGVSETMSSPARFCIDVFISYQCMSKARRVDVVSGMVIRRGEGVKLVVTIRELVAGVWGCQRQCPVLRVFV